MSSIKSILNETVITVSGKEVARKNTQRIKGIFYEIGVDVFRVKNKDGKERHGKNWMWHVKDNGIIAYNIETKTYDRIHEMKEQGYIEMYYDKKESKGYGKPDLYKTVYDDSRNAYSSKEVAEQFNLMYHPQYDAYVHKTNFSDKDLKHLKNKTYLKGSSGLDYQANNNNKDYRAVVSEHSTYVANMEVDEEKLHPYNQMVRDVTFGVEYETSSGCVPSNVYKALGVVPLRDGSINEGRGIEYTSIVMSGIKGIKLLQMQTEELSNSCSVDHTCSLHFHFGNIPKTRDFALAIYKLSTLIQDEIFQLVSPYKKDPVNRAGLRKNYCSKLSSMNYFRKNINVFDPQDVKINFQELFSFVSDGHEESFDYNFETLRHPSGSVAGSGKWNIHARYYWLNLVPYVFGNSKTVEFRPHNGTVNFYKTINLFLICNAIIRYTLANKQSILSKDFNKISLDDILDMYPYEFDKDKGVFDEDIKIISDNIKEYIKERKETFNTAESKGDYIVKKEFEQDDKYTFKFEYFK
jgi:hypothetical protein